ncbi:hypothetical protein QQ054_07180 [Oscillatoria amoena NRMC-F 0135]|nr:hypothetical protein [Oscillatoria amoena NRMC-F 0135]
MERRVQFYVLALFMFAMWTIVIKYINPLCWSWANWRVTGEWTQPAIFLDFWPVIHVWMAVWLWTRARFAWSFAIGVSVVEIVIIAVKFAEFYANPMRLRTKETVAFDYFMTHNWFINKSFLIIFFVIILIDLLRPSLKNYLTRKDTV